MSSEEFGYPLRSVEPLADDLQFNPEDSCSKSIDPASKHYDHQTFGFLEREDEQEMLDSGPVTLGQRICGIVSHGGTIASIYTLASATLGAGIVAIPAGFLQSGIAVSTALLLVVYGCTVYSIALIGIAKDQTGLRSYEEMARGLLGRGWDYLTAGLMFVFCWGTCVGYVTSTENLLTPVLSDPTADGFLQSTAALRLITSALWLVGMLSLSLPKEINSLRYASTVGVTMVCFLVLCMIIHSAQNGLAHGIPSGLNWTNSGINAINGLTVYIFAFICQVNVFEIYSEMTRPTPKRLTITTMLSMGMVTLLYWLAGFFGYCDFGAEVNNTSVLLLYQPRKNIMFAVAYIGMVIKLCVGFAICIQPARDAVYYCLHMGKTSDVKDWFNWLVSGFLATTALLCGLFVPNINIVFSLLGGVCGSFLGFLFPAYFFIYAGGFTYKNVGIWHYFGCFILIIGAAVALVFGTAAAFYEQFSS